MQKISFKEKFEKIMNHFNLNATSFSKEIGNSDNSAISHLLKKDSKPSLVTINKIINRFPMISLDWLIMDKGQMIVNSSIPTAKMSGEEAKEIRKESNLPIKEFASRIGYESTNSIYFNESKENISPSYQKKLKTFLNSNTKSEGKNYRDLYIEALAKLEESKSQTLLMKFEVEKLKKICEEMNRIMKDLKNQQH